MSDYISREAAVKIAQKYGLVNGSALGRHTGLADCIAIEIEGLPAADVEPVRHGRWMHEETEGGFHIWSCSRCGRGMNGNPKGTDLYCYHCGAKMDLEDETNDN